MTSSQKEGNQNLRFGFDIGMASVGWAVLDDQRIIDLGVRCFDKAETADKGESLNLARRMARLARRRLRHRRERLRAIARLLAQYGLIENWRFFKQQHPITTSLWALRVAGLDRLLSAEEWARVIYHLAKHRGFHWASRAEEKAAEGDGKSEGGQVKRALNQTSAALKDGEYRSVAEMLCARFPKAQRNKHGEYSKALARKHLAAELHTLFAQQRQLGNPFANAQLEAELLGTQAEPSGLFWQQRPPLSGEQLLKMLGHCTFEKAEYRAPKASFSAERQVWLTKLNNLRVLYDGKKHTLSAAAHQHVLHLPYQFAKDLTYKQLGTALIKGGFLPQDFHFDGLHYPAENDTKGKDPEAAAIVKLPGFHALREAFTRHQLKTEWESLKSAAIDGSAHTLDSIAWVLSVYKTDEEVSRELAGNPP